MVAWALISSSLDALYRPTSLKVAEARKSILRRVLKGPNGKLSIGEFAIFYDELMVRTYTVFLSICPGLK